MISVLQFDHYKEFLSALEQERSKIQKGFRSRLAEHLEIQNAYISQVLNGNAHFSLEQGIRIAQFLNFNEVEKKMFMLLIEKARSGTQDLQNYFQAEINLLKETQTDLNKRVHAEALDKEKETIYYSHWVYSAVHVLITIPQFRNITAICQALQLPTELISEVVLFLVQANLVHEEKGQLIPGSVQIHLSRKSPNIKKHHVNWRLAAIHSLATEKKNDLHYSTVSSLSQKDADLLAEKMRQLIKVYVDKVKPSKEEVLYNFNLDFYKLSKGT